jgi:hypothetical protein
MSLARKAKKRGEWMMYDTKLGVYSKIILDLPTGNSNSTFKTMCQLH